MVKKMISWNVNGLRACVTKGFETYFKEANADVFCLQETKLQEGQRILLKLEANGKEDTARAQEIKESMKMTGCMLSDAAKICD